MSEMFLLTAVYFGTVLLYAVLNARKNAPYDFRTPLDARIPFVAAFIVPYFGLFLFVPAAIAFLFATPFGEPYLVALSIAGYFAGIFWFFLPARMFRPHVAGRNIFEKLVLLLYRDDPHANGFPSAHVFTSVISSHYLAQAFPAAAPLAWLIGGLVAASTLFVKQHRIADVFGGILWALFAILLAGRLLG